MTKFASICVGIVLVSALATPSTTSTTRGTNHAPISEVTSTIVTGADAGGSSQVIAVDGATLGTLHNFLAYAVAFTGGVRVAAGDVNGDGVADIITGPGLGGGPHVRVFDGKTGNNVQDFMAFGAGASDDIYVAAGRMNSDPYADIVVGAGAGSTPFVKVFDGSTQVVIHNFLAHTGVFTGGVRVATGDVNGDGVADIITGPGGGPNVKVFDGKTLGLLANFFAFAPTFVCGIYVASARFNSDPYADIIVGTGSGISATVKVFDGMTLAPLADFSPFDTAFQGGVRVAAADLNGDGLADIVAGAGPGNLPEVRVFDAKTQGIIRDFNAYDVHFTGGVYVGAIDALTIALPRQFMPIVAR